MLEFIAALIWKALATAAVIIGAARVGEQFGPVMASVLMTLPMNAGPGFLFIAMEEDGTFLTRGALFAFAAAGPVLVFMAVFARLAPHWPYLVCLALASATWWLPMLLVITFEEHLDLSLAAVIVAVGLLCARMINRVRVAKYPTPMRSAWSVLILRASVAGIFVAIVAALSPLIGPSWAGLLLGFPMVVTVSAWVMHARYGGEFTASVLRAGQRSLASYGGFCLSLALLADYLPPVLAVLAAFTIACAIAALLAYSSYRAVAINR